MLRELFESDSRLQRIYHGTVFPAISLNFGPSVATRKHKDYNNLADGLCWIMALGNFDPTKGGHLILWELGLVVQFPPGSSVLIPSAIISHQNVGVRAGETRSSITQYAAGGLFRWVNYGCRTWDQLVEADSALADESLAERENRWRESIELYSKCDSLASDREAVFYS